MKWKLFDRGICVESGEPITVVGFEDDVESGSTFIRIQYVGSKWSGVYGLAYEDEIKRID